MIFASWYTLFYLFTVLDKVSFLLAGLTVACAVGTGVSLMAYSESYTSEKEKLFSKWAKVFVTCGLIFLITNVLLPDKKDMLLIVAGGSVGEFVSHNEDAKAIPSEVTKWLRAELKSATAELNPAVQKKKQELEGLDKEDLVKRLLAAGDSLK